MCHENSNPMMDLTEKVIFPMNIAKSGIYCKTFREITTQIEGRTVKKV
jgi:hypothetical protein